MFLALVCLALCAIFPTYMSNMINYYKILYFSLTVAQRTEVRY